MTDVAHADARLNSLFEPGSTAEDRVLMDAKGLTATPGVLPEAPPVEIHNGREPDACRSRPVYRGRVLRGAQLRPSRPLLRRSELGHRRGEIPARRSKRASPKTWCSRCSIYRALVRPSKALVKCYLAKTTGYSRVQLTRLIRQHRETAKVVDRRDGNQGRPFARPTLWPTCA